MSRPTGSRWRGRAPGAPPSWALTAALFATLRDEPRLLALAARIDPERLPALLFVAAVMALIERERPTSLAVALPAAGGRQPPLLPDFAAELRAFCLRRGDDLLALAAAHRYQMSEPARCAHLLPAVAAIAAEVRRPLALVDLGTGAASRYTSTPTDTSTTAPAARSSPSAIPGRP